MNVGRKIDAADNPQRFAISQGFIEYSSHDDAKRCQSNRTQVIIGAGP
jgi:hypothetical protein